MVPTIEILLTVGSTLLLMAFASRRATFRIVKEGLDRIFFLPEYRWPLCLAVAVMGINVVETHFDGKVTAALGYDITGWVYRLEGNLAAGIQQLSWQPAIYAFSFVYLVLFMAIMAAPLLLTAGIGNLAAFVALSRGLTLNYLIAFPFYIFFPVQEMWSGNPQNVRLLVNEISPAIMEAYRSTSALDNCFPSLHTSLSMTMAFIVSRYLPRPFCVAIWLIALSVLASTLYLGIHWITDMAAGLLLAAFVSWASNRRLPSESPRRSPAKRSRTRSGEPLPA